MSELPEETPAIKQEMTDHDEMFPSTTISSVLEVFKQELGALKTEGDCTITTLLISEPAGVAKYEIIPEEPIVTENAAPEKHGVVISGEPDGEIGFFRDENNQYCCTLCSYASHTRLGLNDHQSRVHGRKRSRNSHSMIFPCSLCSFKGSRGDLYKHRKNIHGHELGSLKTLKHCCSICNTKFLNAKCLAKHKVRHFIKTDYKCNHCSLFFSHVGSLETHVSQRCQSGLKKEVNCPHCDAKYFTKDRMKYHLIHSHKSLLSEEEIMANSHVYVCSVTDCKKRFRSLRSLDNHKKTHKPYSSCPHCGRFFRYLSKHMKRIHSDPRGLKRIFSCSLCSFKGSPGELYEHRKTDHVHELKKLSRISCPFAGCKKTFRYPFMLSKHIRCKHSESASGSGSTKTAQTNCSNLILDSKETTFTCKDCSETFTTEIELDLHKLSVAHKQKLFGNNFKKIEKIEYKMKPFQCNICSKRLATKINLMRHQMIHSGKQIGKMSCPECNILLYSKRNLKNHIMRKHMLKESLPPENPVCKGCNEIFRNEKVLRKHMKYCVHIH